MKKRIVALLAAISVLMLACSSALASEEEFHKLLARIVDPEKPVAYTFVTLKLGTLSPTDNYDPSWMVEVLELASLTPVPLDEAPDGEFVALDFPEEGFRYDFFITEKEKNYARQVNPDKTEEFYTVTMPEDVFVTVSEVISMEADKLALADGAELHEVLDFPEDGWVADSLNGAVWTDDRAELEIFTDSYHFFVVISWGGGVDVCREWLYLCEYDAESNTLKALYSSCNLVTYDEDGNETDRQEFYAGESEALFSLNDQGRVTVSDAADGLLDGKSFGREPAAKD